MSLLAFYHRCCSADWHYEYAEGSAWKRGSDAMDTLRKDAAQSPAHQRIFDAIKLSQAAGSVLPQFGEAIQPTIDVASVSALDEAIIYHAGLATTAYTTAKEAEDRGSSDPAAVKQYFLHNGIEHRLIDQKRALGVKV